MGQLIRIVAAAWTALILTTSEHANAQWQPTKPVQFWVTFGRGAHADIWARQVSSIIEKYKMSPYPFEVVNIPKGAGVEAFPRFANRVGDNHTIMLILPNAFTVPLFKPNVKFDVAKMTPIAGMGEEPLALWVKASRHDIKDLNDFIRVAKAKGKDFKMAGPPLGTPRAMLTEMVSAMYGLGVSYTGIKRIGSTARVLAEGDFDATIHNPAEQTKLADPSAIKPIAFFSNGRLKKFLTTPTIRETGMQIAYTPSRTVIGPPDMNPKASKYFEEIIKRAFQTSDWQKLREARGHIGTFLNSSELKIYLTERIEKHKRWKMAIEVLSSK